MIEDPNEPQERETVEIDILLETGILEVVLAGGRRGIHQHIEERILFEDETRMNAVPETHLCQSRIRLRDSNSRQILGENCHMR